MNWWSTFKFNCLSCILYAAFTPSDDDSFVCSNFKIFDQMQGAAVQYQLNKTSWGRFFGLKWRVFLDQMWNNLEYYASNLCKHASLATLYGLNRHCLLLGIVYVIWLHKLYIYDELRYSKELIEWSIFQFRKIFRNTLFKIWLS